MSFNKVEEECTKEVGCIYGQHQAAGKPPVADCRNQRPDANCKVSVSDLELELLMLLPPPHSDLVGFIID
jgi:hypothetical protein